MGGQNRNPWRKHVPQRTCVVCRQVRAKRDLTRVVYQEGTGIALDPVGKAPGRGAYLCDQRKCWEQAARSDIIGKALRIALSAQDRALLEAHGQTLPETKLTEM